MNQNVHPDHMRGLHDAYSHHPPVIARDGVLYIAGTRLTPQEIGKDAIDDARMLFNVYSTRRYAQARQVMRDAAAAGEPIHTVVGHSLGASIAGTIAHDYKLQKVLYSHPAVEGPGSSNEFGGTGDPLTWLNFSSQNHWAGLNPHDYRSVGQPTHLKRFKQARVGTKRASKWSDLPRVKPRPTAHG